MESEINREELVKKEPEQSLVEEKTPVEDIFLVLSDLAIDTYLSRTAEQRKKFREELRNIVDKTG